MKRFSLIAAALLFLMGAAANPKVDIEGNLRVLSIEDRAEQEYFIEDSKGVRHRLKMPMSYKHDKNLQSGQWVRVRGTRAIGEKSAVTPTSAVIAVESLEAVERGMIILPNTFGTHGLLVYSVNYANVGGPTTNATARAFMDNVVQPFFQESSYGKFSFSGSKDPKASADFIEVTVPTPVGCDMFTMVQNAYAQALKAGYPVNKFGAYWHSLYLIPSTPCGFSGLADIGGIGTMAICNGEISHRVCSHEIGHNLGLYHSGCANGYGGGSEYCDFMDVMGNSGNSMGAWNRERLGWLNNAGMPPLTTVTTPGDYSIRALNTQDSAVKGLKIAKTDGFTYYLTYRNGVGIGGAEGKPAGVYVHQGPSADGVFGPSQLFRMLPIGEVWREQNIPIWLMAKSCTAIDCVVNVSFGGPPLPKPAVPIGLTLQFPSTIKYNGKDISLGVK